MIIHPLVSTALVLLGSSALLPAATTLVNVDFNCSNAVTPAVGTFSGSGVLGGGNWNGIATSRNISSLSKAAGTLVTSAGGATNLGFSVATFNNSYDLGTSVSSVDSTQRGLMADYLYLNSGNTTATINITGLDAGTTAWTLVLYGANGQNSGSKFTIGADIKFTTDTGTIGSTLVSGDEYVTFTGTGNGPISITWDKVGTFSNFNGFQLQQVPEPSAAILGGFGLLALLRRRRA